MPRSKRPKSGEGLSDSKGKITICERPVEIREEVISNEEDIPENVDQFLRTIARWVIEAHTKDGRLIPPKRKKGNPK